LLALLARRRREREGEDVPGPDAGSGRPVLSDLTRATFDRFVNESPCAVVDVWAPWCGPCPAMVPVFEALAREFAPEVRFGRVNADDEPELVRRWNVEGLPTILLFERGRLVDRLTGAFPFDTLDRRLKATFGRPALPGQRK